MSIKKGMDLDKYEQEIRKAAQECPTECIKYEEN